MKYLCVSALSMLSLLAAPTAFAQAGTVRSPFEELLEVTHFVQNYKESAVVSARVFAARAQGSDREYAAFMAKVAKADLSDVQICLSKAYEAGPLTRRDAEELVQIFRSPIGVRLVDLSQRMMIADLERGSHKPLDPSLLTDSERKDLALLYQRPVFTRYNTFIASPAQAAATRSCIASSKVGRESGIKF